MIDSDRLDELATFRPDDDTPDDAKVRIDTRDLRDLVALIPVVRAAMDWDDARVDDVATEQALLQAVHELKVRAG